jgi:hypothetical protein
MMGPVKNDQLGLYHGTIIVIKSNSKNNKREKESYRSSYMARQARIVLYGACFRTILLNDRPGTGAFVN